MLPDGYVAEVVATGFKTPVHCTFDPDGRCYVTEAGFKIESRPRILRVDVETGDKEVLFELPEERWIKPGAMTGACWHDGSLYVSNTDTLFRLDADGGVSDVVAGLPGRGDHQTNHPTLATRREVVVGTATNTGVVGPANFNYEWLRDFPEASSEYGLRMVAWGRMKMGRTAYRC